MKDWILVVDDDTSNLKMASHILTAEDFRVSVLKSGEAAVEFLKTNRPDLLLLDVHMGGMSGFETFDVIKKEMGEEVVPVIFLTADDDTQTETHGLKSGAMDFIKKPFVPEILLIRVRHTVELVKLQRSLSSEVEKKSEALIEQYKRVERISMQVVEALSGAIDAKDTYTNGHSRRVALYSKMIAERAGKDKDYQDNIYMMGLLHDVGKIGVPDAIINKPAKLTDTEFEVIMNHPVMGARILKSITEFPNLSTGARWHHERFDGKGYPDGLSGYDIPEEARMIGVADAYDAMTSRRSYRDVLPQAKVREEFVKGRGTQFDPDFADIMIGLMDEDVNYDMREK